MKILFITNNFPTKKHPIFGIFVKEQLESLLRRGLKVEVFFINGRERGKKGYVDGLKNLRKRLEKKDYDLVHCHHAFSAIILLLTCRWLKTPRICSYQNPPKNEGGLLFLFLIKSSFNAVILKHREITSGKKFHYLPNGVDLEFFREHPEEECVNVLGLERGWNYIVFLDSYKRRSQKRRDRFDAIINLLQDHGNPHKVRPLVLTSTDRSKIPFFLSFAAVHVICSDFEGSPNSVKESLACNTPVVSTPVGNVRAMLSGVAGCFISDSFEPTELANLVVKAISNDRFDGRKTLVEKSLEIGQVAKNLELLYEQLISKND